MGELNRRDFLKKAAIGTAVVAGAGALSACGVAATNTEQPAPAPAAEAVETPEKWDYETDVVIAGAGNGGLSAAAAAVDEGKKVILLEISSIVGGGSAWSGGVIHAWGLQNFEEYNEYTEGLHHPVLAKLFVETLRKDYFPWLESIGAPLVPGDPNAYGPTIDPRLGEQGDIAHVGKRKYFNHLANFTESKGGTIMLNTRAYKLITNEDNHVIGLQAMNKEGQLINIKATSVILATGNFMANKEMLQKYVGPYADTARNMGVPYNTGDGIMMAQSVGAILSGGMSTWSGTFSALTPTTPVVDDPEEYERIVAEDPETMPGVGVGRISPPMWVGLLNPTEAKGILVNLDGKRFRDESCVIQSKYARLPQAVLEQREGMAYMIADEIIAEDTPGSHALVDQIIAEGGKVVVADSLEELAEGLSLQGVYKKVFLKTINEYNAAIDAGRADELDIPRVTGHYKISTPPFYAIPTTAQIYCTYGGIEINEKTEVLDYQRRPIPGLYAVPPAAGGIFRSIYAGGIAIAGTFGYLAGKAAKA
ncbi:MAG: FAD-dependent oxidoreductase [Tissierellia bacterium]|nr:FAD-dependent oxidoreductase [Tissierellia bacterium]